MHSSRMRSSRSLTVAGKWCLLSGGCLLPWGCLLPEGYPCMCDRWVKPLMRSTPRHQFLVQMPKAKVSWLLCIGRLVSKTDNVMHFARLVKQACVDLVSDLFGLWAICLFLGLTWGLDPMRVGTVSIWGNSLKPFDLLGASDTAMLIKFGLPG